MTLVVGLLFSASPISFVDGFLHRFCDHVSVENSLTVNVSSGSTNRLDQ